MATATKSAPVKSETAPAQAIVKTVRAGSNRKQVRAEAAARKAKSPGALRRKEERVEKKRQRREFLRDQPHQQHDSFTPRGTAPVKRALKVKPTGKPKKTEPVPTPEEQDLREAVALGGISAGV